MKRNSLIILICLGVLAWAIFLAVGSYLGGINPGGVRLNTQTAWKRGGIMLLCPLLFLLGWVILLVRYPVSQKPRLRSLEQPSTEELRADGQN